MSKQLTIEEAKQLKQECEKRIAEFVQGFEERTGYVQAPHSSAALM